MTSLEEGGPLEEGKGQVPEVRIQFGVRGGYNRAFGLGQLEAECSGYILMGPWLLAPYGQGAQECPYHLLISLLKHKDLYIKHKYTFSDAGMCFPTHVYK